MTDILDQVTEYIRNYAIVARGHYLASQRAGRFNSLLGVPVVALTAIVGTSIFSTLDQSLETGWKILAGVLSVSAAVLAALQTFLRFSEHSDKHKMAGSRYAMIRRRFELFVLKYSQGGDSMRDEAVKELERLLSRLEELAKDSPSIPDEHYRRAEREFIADNPAEE
jgi:hypothetical protein